jgi:dTDP-glucose pyrophosphorylase
LRALILAGGYGTRLGELTKTIPKALVEVGGIAIIDRTINKLTEIGITEITWVDLPNPMTKAGALAYLGNINPASISAQVYQDAITKAVQRLAPAAKSPKPPAKVKNVVNTVTSK